MKLIKTLTTISSLLATSNAAVVPTGSSSSSASATSSNQIAIIKEIKTWEGCSFNYNCVLSTDFCCEAWNRETGDTNSVKKLLCGPSTTTTVPSNVEAYGGF